MAILFDASGDYLNRTSGAIIDHNAAYTVAGWVERTVVDGTHHLVLNIDAGSNFGDCDQFWLNWFNDPAFGLYVANGGTSSGIIYGASTLAQNTYVHVAVVREDATHLKLYLNGVLEVTVTTSVAGRATATRMSMADLPAGGQPPTGLVTGAWNAWTRALTSVEITAQMAQAAPTDSTSLWAEWLMLAGSGRGDDASANLRHWTSNGTLTDVADPSITYPSSGTTYTDTGAATSVFTGSGAAVATLVDTGSAVSVFTGSGASALTSADAGSAVSIFTGSGAAVATLSDTGSATSVFTGTGVDAPTFVDTGVAASAFTGSGADVAILVDTGTAVLTGAGSGTDANVYLDAGGAVSVATGSGVDAPTFADTGGALAALFGAGADVAILVDAGGGVLMAIGSGADDGPTPPIDLPYQGDAYLYDSAGGTGSIAGGTVLAGPTQTSPTGSTSGATVLAGPTQSSPTGSISGGTVLPPETII